MLRNNQIILSHISNNHISHIHMCVRTQAQTPLYDVKCYLPLYQELQEFKMYALFVAAAFALPIAFRSGRCGGAVFKGDISGQLINGFWHIILPNRRMCPSLCVTQPRIHVVHNHFHAQIENLWHRCFFFSYSVSLFLFQNRFSTYSLRVRECILN